MMLFVALALSLCPQLDEEQSKPEIDISLGCKKCDFMGAKDCSSHGKLFEAEHQVTYCWEAAQCKDCFGALLVDCNGCESGPLFLKRQQQLSKMERFIKSTTEPGVLLERELPRILTDHFDLCVTAKKMKNGSKNMDTHQLMHSMATECEAAASLFDEHFEAQPFNYSNRARLWYWTSEKVHQEVCAEILESNGGADLKFYGVNPAVSSFSNGYGLSNDALEVVRNAVHVSIHLMLSSVHQVSWIGNKKAGWFDVGAAHWYEDKLFARVATYCIDEANSGLHYENGQWRVAMKKYLRKNKTYILPTLTQLTSGVLEEEQHALAWSLYDYVVANHPAALKPMLLGYKNDVESRVLFKKHLEMNIMQVEDAWRAWVAETYPAKDLKPRKKV
jgi:hypothetical protein